MLIALLLGARVPPHADPATSSSLRWRVSRVTDAVVVDSTIFVATPEPILPPDTGGVLALFSQGDAVAPPSLPASNLIFAIIDDGAGGWYVGGSFTGIGGVNTRCVAHLRPDGTVDPGFSVTFRKFASVQGLVLTGSHLVVVGSFAFVNDTPRSSVAVLDAVTGALQAPSPQISGVARAVVLAGDTLYVAGAFLQAGGQAHGNIAAFDLASGALRPAFRADTDDLVTGLVIDGPSLFVTGDFTAVNGTPRHGLAKVALADGAVAAWDPAPDGAVTSMALSGGALHTGGAFTTIGGQPRGHVAALDPVTGHATSWRADADAPIERLAVDDGAVYVAGPFTSVGGIARMGGASVSTSAGAAVLPWHPGLVGHATAMGAAHGQVAVAGGFDGWNAIAAHGLAAIDMRTGLVRPWAPVITSAAPASVFAMLEAGTRLVVGGDFTAVDGTPRENLAAFDIPTGALLPLHVTIDGPIRAMAVIGEVLYAGGAFTTVNGSTRRNLFAVDLVSGQVLPWAPRADDEILALAAGGQGLFVGGSFTTLTDTTGAHARAGLGELTPAGLVTGFDVHATCSPMGIVVRGLAVDAGRLFLTGTVESVQGAVRRHAAAVAVDGGALLPWDPHPDAEMVEPVVDRGAVYLVGSFTAAGGQFRRGLARVDDTTGALSPWTPVTEIVTGVHLRVTAGGLLFLGQMQGEPYARLYFYANEAPGTAPGAPVDVTARLGSGTLSLTWGRAVLGAAPTGYVAEAGTPPGATDIGTVALPSAAFSAANVPPGRYFVRVRAVNDRGRSAPSREILVVTGQAGCTAVPGAPAPPAVTVTGSTVSMSWQPATGASTTAYALFAGTAEGLSDIGTVAVGDATTFTATGVPDGAYFVRVASLNACGSAGASADAVAHVGGVAGPPSPPMQLTATVALGGVVSLSWLDTTAGGAPSGHVIEAGSGPGLADLGTAHRGIHEPDGYRCVARHVLPAAAGGERRRPQRAVRRAGAGCTLRRMPHSSRSDAPAIHWGDDVPAGWTGTWPDALRTVPERTQWTRTMSTLQLHEWIAALKLSTECLHVETMFISPLRKVAPVLILSNPRVTTPEQARASGKPVVFLLGNIHPPEPEAAEAFVLLARDLACGRRRALLDDLIVMIAPIFNVDGTDTFVTQDGSLGCETPHLVGVRENSQGLDLNRDSVKLVTVEANGLFRTLNAWDPLLLLDGHLMDRVSHGYANTYGTATIPAAAPGPRDHMTHTLFPAVRALVREQFGLEVFTHALPVPDTFPPHTWSHDRAFWTVEAKMLVNAYGLRNRFAIITETPGQPTFERRTYAHYAYAAALLDYVRAHGPALQQVVAQADADTVSAVRASAEDGSLINFLDGRYESAGTIDLLVYRTNEPAYRPGTSLLSTRPGTASGPPEVVRGVDDLTKPVGTRSARVPRAYLLPPSLAHVAAKLQAHGIGVRTLDAPATVDGEQFTITRLHLVTSYGYDMTTLDGAFTPATGVVFPAGSFLVDMAQPLANAAFYYLEPQSRDGFVGWHVLDDALHALMAAGGPALYPVFKSRRLP